MIGKRDAEHDVISAVTAFCQEFKGKHCEGLEECFQIRIEEESETMQESIDDISITELPPIFKEYQEGVRYFLVNSLINKLRPT